MEIFITMTNALEDEGYQKNQSEAMRRVDCLVGVAHRTVGPLGSNFASEELVLDDTKPFDHLRKKMRACGHRT
jgi:hypothetical protein